MADADISDEIGEIVLKMQDASVVDENVSPLTFTATDSGLNVDAIMKVLQSIQKQNQEIENRLEQQGLKTEPSSKRTVAHLQRTRYSCELSSIATGD